MIPDSRFLIAEAMRHYPDSIILTAAGGAHRNFFHRILKTGAQRGQGGTGIRAIAGQNDGGCIPYFGGRIAQARCNARHELSVRCLYATQRQHGSRAHGFMGIRGAAQEVRNCSVCGSCRGRRFFPPPFSGPARRDFQEHLKRWEGPVQGRPSDGKERRSRLIEAGGEIRLPEPAVPGRRPRREGR